MGRSEFIPEIYRKGGRDLKVTIRKAGKLLSEGLAMIDDVAAHGVSQGAGMQHATTSFWTARRALLAAADAMESMEKCAEKDGAL